MKTLIDIDNSLLKKAMKASGAYTKKETVRRALEELIKANLRRELKGMAGSGIIKTSISELKELRLKRQMLHEKLTLKN
ncbi:MAG: type II toxin-antitoxin system VapB family antitoxin [Nitrospirae bacterium]|nr:type II toxin-antitoxin system VapB family antitoxin [Nitrospirota bacterium]